MRGRCAFAICAWRAGPTDVLWVQTPHPTDHALSVTWSINGTVVPDTDNSYDLELGAVHATAGDSVEVRVSDPTTFVRDPAIRDSPAMSQTRAWTVDNVPPTAPAQLSTPLTTLPGAETHDVYFEQFTMGLTPQDGQPGFVVGEFRLDHDGWYNYFGWPDAPEGTPFLFTPAGTEIKKLSYGSLGTGGMSKAPFEQDYSDFEPGYGTHTVEHHAIDAAGNTGPADEFVATVLPGATPACTRTLTGPHRGGLVDDGGVTCLDGARVSGSVVVGAGGSFVATDSTISGSVVASGGVAVQLIGSTVRGSTSIAGSTDDVTLTGTTFDGTVTLTGNDSGAYGSKLAGNRIRGDLVCAGNDNGVGDFGARNDVRGPALGDCADLG